MPKQHIQRYRIYDFRFVIYKVQIKVLWFWITIKEFDGDDYYDKGWKRIGTQVATANYLTFENVPANHIYWLSNLSNGNEELPFYYQNDTQFFINLTPMREE